jgi:formate hydrogenlyase subunit 6/NADH:ubiquinone oxidoreductase subunit I
MTACNYGALKYKGPGAIKEKDESAGNQKEPRLAGRREAIAAIGLLGLSAAARSFNVVQTGKLKPSKYAITPPGSLSVENLKDKCTSCNACMAACPNGIIKPASYQYGLDGIMLPVLSYENHFCGYECNTCSQVCPTGAIIPVEIEKKRLIQIGVVNFTLEKCIVYKDGTDCGACDEHCPTKAITMVPYGSTGLFIPSTNTDICIGCGGCEYICPARPKAMIINSKDIHGVAKKPLEEKQKEVKVDEFGF